jgi:uncharacterized membrane protein
MHIEEPTQGSAKKYAKREGISTGFCFLEIFLLDILGLLLIVHLPSSRIDRKGEQVQNDVQNNQKVELAREHVNRVVSFQISNS